MSRRLIHETEAERVYEVTDAGGVVVGYDTEAIPTPAMLTEASIRAKARSALTANATFLAVPSPSAAQTTAQVKLLTRETQALIRLLLAEFDADDA